MMRLTREDPTFSCRFSELSVGYMRDPNFLTASVAVRNLWVVGVEGLGSLGVTLPSPTGSQADGFWEITASLLGATCTDRRSALEDSEQRPC